VLPRGRSSNVGKAARALPVKTRRLLITVVENLPVLDMIELSAATRRVHI
jgi:hypothetical protein